MVNKTFFAIHLGCKVNLFEINAVTSQLLKSGLKQVQNINDAQIVIINTCSVTSAADAKSRNIIMRAKHAKKHPIVAVMGCYSQINNEWFKKNKVDIVIGNNDKSNIAKLILNYKKPINQIVPTNKINNFDQFPFFECSNNTRAFIKIQDGCNFYCTYCLIPYCRGKQRAANHKTIIQNIKKYVDKQYKEIVLTGVNTAGYNDGEYNFFDLLNEINKIKGDFRVRISSLEPFQINKKIINLFANNKERWANQIHLCLQSGNNQILKQMHRKYNVEQFIELVKIIRKKMKNVAITTDYMVAFGNETEQQFIDSLNNVKKINFANMNIFIFSRRKWTMANKMFKCDINKKIANLRYEQVDAVRRNMQKKYLKLFVNKNLSVVVEKSKLPIVHGYSSEFIKVYFESKINLCRYKVNVKIIKLYKDGLFGLLYS